MQVSPEVIGVLVAIFVAALTVVGGVGAVLGWFWKLIERRFDSVDRRFEQVDQRFEQVDKRFDEVDKRFDALATELRGEIEFVKNELTEVKIAVARLEGPRPPFIVATGR